MFIVKNTSVVGVKTIKTYTQFLKDTDPSALYCLIESPIPNNKWSNINVSNWNIAKENKAKHYGIILTPDLQYLFTSNPIPALGDNFNYFYKKSDLIFKRQYIQYSCGYTPLNIITNVNSKTKELVITHSKPYLFDINSSNLIANTLLQKVKSNNFWMFKEIWENNKFKYENYTIEELCTYYNYPLDIINSNYSVCEKIMETMKKEDPYLYTQFEKETFLLDKNELVSEFIAPFMAEILSKTFILDYN